MVERFTDWDKWKKTLSQAVNIGEKVGLSDETIIKIGSRIGDFLEHMADPENKEQRVIKELWDVADEDEQKSLTNMLVKVIKQENENR
jgi:hypothetical protein